ncbi:MAG: GntR family transcriptional regulator [Beijerinckiaceae bacterium]|jgi:DNA-binding GntR family transcriptional regulator|nr:GntR family transcriptional regulator [Beijerinckiaceae bacterium]
MDNRTDMQPLGDDAAPDRARPPRMTAASHILGVLRQDILSVRLKPGEALSEKWLTARFGVSRTPVREALMRLAEEGLVEIYPQSGTYVGRIPAASLPEAVVIRQALEGMAVALFAERAGAQDLDALEHLIARQDALARIDDRDGFHAADEAFHERIAQGAGCPGLWRLAQQAKNQIDRCRRMTLPVPGRMLHVIDEHRTILLALRKRQKQAASEAMQVHLSAVLPDAETLKTQFPDYFS